jgi:hypothetical protein
MRRVNNLCLLLVLCLAGCAANPPTQQEFADHGRDISQKELESLAIGWFNTHLKDPDSLRYGCRPYKIGRLVGMGHGPTSVGYILDCVYNARNSFGGYGDNELLEFSIRDGLVLATNSLWLQGERCKTHPEFCLR